MYEFIAEVAGEALAVAVYVLASGLLTLLGVVAEQTSLANYSAGDVTAAAWLAVMGAVALYAGLYMLGYRTLRDRVLADRA